MPAERLTRRNAEEARIGIVHLGLGAFFRAFGAPWIAEAVRAGGGDWDILGVSLRSPAVRDALKPQGYAYTAVELAPQGERFNVVENVRDMLVAPEDPEALLAAMAHPDVRIVSLTITEKGYCHNPATGELDPKHPDIVYDCTGELPKSAPGFIVRALQRRKKAGRPPFTVMSCDNLPNNGKVARGVVIDLARLIDPELADWIEAEGCFPSTMVDRIVPATKPEDIARVEEAVGYHDAAPVMHEPFRQWVIEDEFVGGERPDFAAVGVQMVEDVTPFEHMKLRMLNGAHSSLAYLGYLAGHETIADTTADAAFAGFVEKLWGEEIIPALTPPEGVDLTAYAGMLLDRFRNPSIRHRTWQIAMDGSQKLPQRILSTLQENLDNDRASPRLLLAVSAWMRYVAGTDEKGAAIDVQDPLAERLWTLTDEAPENGDVHALLTVREVFPADLAARLEPLLQPVHAALVAKGARASVEALG
ncbi:mannitol dehydrogenase family protein [Tropicimonas sediminicola]|uniref:Fructuronate reductase n=1 Tax=Tropicimonas sediminicola TaxID=1031541 RepID=A0A239KBK4_9RHOB|nr:mannitol dehydrogenase family protein [Tropicimonas sediminicola]SNT15787.1 fructuronate reductase [Tropicimonas sediminicola]